MKNKKVKNVQYIYYFDEKPQRMFALVDDTLICGM